MARQLSLFLLFVSISIGCAQQVSNRSPESPPVPIEVNPLYEQALRDARNPEPLEVVDDLWGLHDHTPGLQWSNEEARRLKVVTWKQGPDAYWSVGPVSLDFDDLWVTLAPEVQQLCRASGFAPAGSKAERLVELLGLPPGAGNDTFVELWVDPADMFRPCPDPEIDDARCGIAFPAGVSAEHRRWINDLRSVQYSGAQGGYPWTQLGYTYDWSPRSTSNRGASEFIVRKGAGAEVIRMVATTDYCGETREPSGP